jgi:hypothetical protein
VSGRADDLLRDLAVLLTRHPPKEWTRLAELLENDAARSRIVLFLREISSSNHPSPRRRGQQKVSVPKETPGKAKKHAERPDLELSRRSISELRELSRRGSLSYSPKDSKQRLIGRLLRASSGAPSRVRRAPEIREKDSGDYAQWAEIIMGRDKGKH